MAAAQMAEELIQMLDLRIPCVVWGGLQAAEHMSTESMTDAGMEHGCDRRTHG